MNRIQPEVDVISDILKAVMTAQPNSVFAKSLYQQYCERGGLSKKQLEGLYSKASKITSISVGKKATLQAIILKKPTRYKSEVTTKELLPAKDGTTGNMIEAILVRYPQHKAVLLYKTKYDTGIKLTAAELSELHKFSKILLK